MRGPARTGHILMTGAWLAAVLIWAPPARAQAPRSPEEFLGHRVGADYQLARWESIVEYFHLIERASDRVNVRHIGETTEGLPMIYAEISSPGTIENVDLHRRNQRMISDPRLILDDATERELAGESKVVILINCSLHATEIAATQMSMDLLYDLATSDSPRVAEILERVILLLIPSANPDGLNMVVDWYEPSISRPWEGTGMPWIYQKYAGHDNNRDWFMLNLRETRNTTKLIYEDWRPTIVYDVHQMGNRGARLFVPPFHDPKNANVPPLIDHALMIIGGHMAQELSRNGRTGVVNGAIYDNWWAGGFRTTVYRHNMIGILTETASVNLASPVFQRKSQLRGGSRGFPAYQIATNFPEPWPGGWWRLRDIVDYELTAIMSLLTYAARYHEELQGNFLHMGRNAIEQGLSEPPFAWLVPPDQRDPRTATWMLDLLQATGIDVHQAEDDFVADGVAYPAGTFIMYCSQPFRAHLMDMMERQIYPDREIYPGGPAEAPYDNAGWTLPLQMGVRRVAVALPFVARARLLDAIPIPQGNLEGRDNARQYVIAAQYNDDYRLINRLNKAGIPIGIYRGGEDWDLADGRTLPAGSILIRDGRSLRDAMPDVLQGVSSSPIGISGLDEEIESAIVEAPPPRIGLYQPWTASMDEGWTRYVLDTFEYNYTTVHNADILAGNLHDRYDCLILPSVGAQSILRGRAPDTTAPEYVGGIGPEGVISLQDFVQDGGTLICVDQSSNLPIGQFNIPVSNIVRGKSSEEFYCPGSVLRVRLDPSHPVAYGMPEWISAYFTRSMAFEVERSEGRSGSRQGRRGSPRENEEDEETGQRGGAGGAMAGAPGDPSRSAAARFPTEVVGRYSDTVLLESGWIRGEELIRDQPAVVEVQYGEGRIVMFAFRVLHRAQPHGTFRLLFNAIQLSTLGEAEE